MPSHPGYHWVDSWRLGRPTRSLLPAELATDRTRDACRYNECLRYDDTGKASSCREQGRFEESKSAQHTNPHRDSRTKNRKHGKMHPLPVTFLWLNPTEERQNFQLGGTETGITYQCKTRQVAIPNRTQGQQVPTRQDGHSSKQAYRPLLHGCGVMNLSERTYCTTVNGSLQRLESVLLPTH